MKLTLVDSSCPELASCLIGYIGGEIENNGKVVRRVIPVRPNCFIQIILEGRYSLHDVQTGRRVQPPQAGFFGTVTRYGYDFEVDGGLGSKPNQSLENSRAP